MDNIESQMYEDLSVRSKNIIISYGGIEKALENYIQKKDFLEARNCGLVTAKELNEFFINLYALHLERDLKINNVDLFNQYCELVNFYKIEKNKLSRQTQKVLFRWEFARSCTSILTYYNFIKEIISSMDNFLLSNKHQDARVLSELLSLFNQIGHIYKEINNESTSEKVLTIKDVDENINIYFSKKSQLSNRSKNILDRIENDIHIDQKGNLGAIIYGLIIGDINLVKRKNLGIKSYKEIISFLNEVKNDILSLSIDVKGDLASDSSLTKFKEIKGLRNAIIRLFEGHFVEDSFIDNLIEENSYRIIELTILLIWIETYKSSKKSNLVFFKIFFESYWANSKLSEMAEEVSLSRERVRQIKFSLTRGILVNRVIQKIQDQLKGWSPLYTINFLDLIVFDSTNFNAEFSLPDSKKPTTYVYQLILLYLLKNEYILINDLLDTRYNAKALESPDVLIFLKIKAPINKEILIRMFNWLDEEIVNFELAQFEFDIFVLVKRFFNESYIVVDDGILNDLTYIVKLAKVDFSGTTIERKGLKNQDKSRIRELIIHFFNEVKRPAKTKEIQVYLDNNYNFRTIPQILAILRDATDVFRSLTTGLWVLAEWEAYKGYSGSLRDLILTRLNTSDEPLHISEILSYVSNFKITNERNILGNLKLMDSREVHLFNCGYIGLSSKNYDLSWYQLPKVVGSYFAKSAIMKGRVKYGENLGNYLSTKLGYPKIHVDYLLSKIEK